MPRGRMTRPSGRETFRAVGGVLEMRREPGCHLPTHRWIFQLLFACLSLTSAFNVHGFCLKRAGNLLHSLTSRHLAGLSGEALWTRPVDNFISSIAASSECYLLRSCLLNALSSSSTESAHSPSDRREYSAETGRISSDLQKVGSVPPSNAFKQTCGDHKVLGAELGLFSFPKPRVGSSCGLGPALLPRGQVVMLQLQQVLRKLQSEQGFQEVRTGSLAQANLWCRSGHLKHFADNMFALTRPQVAGEAENNADGQVSTRGGSPKAQDAAVGEVDPATVYLLKPMSCPLHLSLFFEDAVRRSSSLPLRISEFGHVFRCEVQSAIYGLLRMREFTQDDGHILCRVNQAAPEIAVFVSTCLRLYKAAGFSTSDIKIQLSTRPENSKGSTQEWDFAEELLRGALDNLGLRFTVADGEGAFYGPKIDLLLPDVNGRLWQSGTLQVDMFSPAAFGLDAASGAQSASREHRLCLLHRAMCGSLERFLGLVLEKSKGHLRPWLAPTQVAVLTVSTEQSEFAQSLGRRLRHSAVRVVVDTRPVHISRKLKAVLRHRTPELWLLGAADQERQTVTVRRQNGEQTVVSVAKALASARRRAKPPL
ncbi:hypothetical protein Efla_001943 [Eimeria flavescens]